MELNVFQYLILLSEISVYVNTKYSSKLSRTNGLIVNQT